MWTWTRGLVVLMALVTPAAARELADAPEIGIFRLSADGKHLLRSEFARGVLRLGRGEDDTDVAAAWRERFATSGR